jgi:hypothetical protein
MNVSWNGMNSLSVNGIAIYVCSSKLLWNLEYKKCFLAKRERKRQALKRKLDFYLRTFSVIFVQGFYNDMESSDAV